jgi:hypothetical protein
MFMTRTAIALSAPDVSAFTKTLKAALDARHASGLAPPSHLELLNLLARAAGLRNFQTLKAQTSTAFFPRPIPESLPTAPTPAVNLATMSPLVRKTLLQFDDERRLVRLPNKFSVQRLAMWAFWTQFEAPRRYTEKEVNAVLNVHHTFGDQATLRRELINMQLLGRKDDCSEYWKNPQQPSDEVQSFLVAWQAGLR